MRNTILSLIASALALIMFGPSGLAQDKAQTWTGWVSDSQCGAKGASANHKACAIKCVTKKGAKWVFVDSQSQKVLTIENQNAVNPDADLGQQMKVSGELTQDGLMHVESISPASQ